jgi:hypothetical protein
VSYPKAIAISSIWVGVAVSAFGSGGYVVLIAFFAAIATGAIADD